MNSDTEARKHIRALIHLVVVGNRNAARWCDYCGSVDPEHQPDCPVFAAEEYLATPDPAVLAVEGGGDEPYTSMLRATGKSTVSQSTKLLAIIDRCGSIGEWKRLGAGRAWIADYERDVALLTSEIATLRSQLAKQSEEMAGMRRALEPFAFFADKHPKSWSNSKWIRIDARPTIGDLRRAKAALIDPKTGEG